MHPISLKYFNTSLELKYQSENKLESLRRFMSFVLLELGFSLLFVCYTLIVGLDKLLEAFKFIGIFILIMVLLLLKKYSFKYLNYFLKFIYFCFVVFFTELIKSLQTNGYIPENAVALMVPLQLILSMLIFTKTNWLICSLYYFLCLVYFFVRLININSNMSPHFSFAILGFFLSLMSFCYMSYGQEKNEKIYYKSLNDSYEKLLYFKLLVQNIFPCPIFIVDYEKKDVKFSNNSALNILSNCSKNTTLQNPSSSETFSYFTNLISSFSILEETSDKKKSDIPSILKEYYENPQIEPFKTQNLSPSQLDLKFLTVNVSLKTNSSEEDLPLLQLENKKFYELKILKIDWEDSVNMLLILNDNTNAFKISELLNLDQYKNQLLASVSHDLRTPLNGLNGMLELTISQIKEKSIQQNLILALKSANLLNFLVNDILDFSQMNFKKLRLNLENINIPEIIAEIRNLIEFQVQQKNINFEVEGENLVFSKIFSDSNRLKQILLNLLSNALKFTHHGTIKIRIEDLTEFPTQPLVRFTVEDTGIGIQHEDISKLFQLFGKLECSKGLNKTGIGLGLTISKMLSRLLSPEHTDGLQVESIYGVGSKFFFYVSNLLDKDHDINLDIVSEKIKIALPEIKSYEFLDETTKLKSDTTCSCSDLMNRRILVVDDDLINIMIAEQYLAFFNIKSMRAMNGLEAFNLVEQDFLLQQNEICMIIMDCNMPILDGFQASEKIRDFIKELNGKRIPILAVTANLTFANQDMCKKSGMDFYLEKPVRRDQLKVMIERILNIKIIL